MVCVNTCLRIHTDVWVFSSDYVSVILNSSNVSFEKSVWFLENFSPKKNEIMARHHASTYVFVVNTILLFYTADINDIPADYAMPYKFLYYTSILYFALSREKTTLYKQICVVLNGNWIFVTICPTD